MILPSYYECGDCGQIEEGQKWEGLRNKCKHCGKSNSQTIWPAPEIRDLFEFINSFDEKSPHYPRVVCVFLSSALELLLENLLNVMAIPDVPYEYVDMLIDALLDGYQGRSRMFTLYSKIGNGTFHEAVKKMGKKQFLVNWDTTVEARNNIVHGRLVNCVKITPDLVEGTIIDALYVFAKLHNQYNAESLQYKVALEKRKPPI